MNIKWGTIIGLVGMTLGLSFLPEEAIKPLKDLLTNAKEIQEIVSK
jgi:hypothetical protein